MGENNNTPRRRENLVEFVLRETDLVVVPSSYIRNSRNRRIDFGTRAALYAELIRLIAYGALSVGAHKIFSGPYT